MKDGASKKKKNVKGDEKADRKKKEDDRMTEGSRDLRSAEGCQQPRLTVWDVEYTA